MSTLPTLIHRSDAIPLTTSAGLFAKIYKKIIYFIWKGKEPKRAKIIWKKVGGPVLLDFKMYYKAIVIRTVSVWYWHKDRHMEQWNRIELRNRPMYIWPIDFQ